MKQKFIPSIVSMKKIVIALLAIIAIASCHKSVEVRDASLNGKWELRSSSGGIAGITYNYPAGNGNTMTFKIDSSFTGTTGISTGTTIHNGTYRTTSNVINGQSRNYLYIKTDNNSEVQYDLTLKKDSLFIYPSGIADGFRTLWIKQ